MNWNLLGSVAEKLAPQKCAAVIAAAGSSSRMGGVDKIVTELAGKPMILRTVAAFQENAAISEIVVVTREELREKIEKLLKDAGMTKVTAVVAGGATRTESVNRGLNWVSQKAKLVAIHDGARPLVSQRVITETVAKAAKTGAAAPAVPVKDTVRLVEGGVGVQTPERAKLFAVQTPQVFDRDLISAAILNAAKKALPITDDCAAAEAMGMKITMTQGEEENFKITTRMDLALANALCRRNDAE